MLSTTIYNSGELIVGTFTDVIQPQSVFDGIFYQVDCRNVGELNDNFSQLYYDVDIQSVLGNECDVHRIADLDKGIGLMRGFHRTALCFQNERLKELSGLYRNLAIESGLEVELFDDISAGFDWLGTVNPEPDIIRR